MQVGVVCAIEHLIQIAFDIAVRVVVEDDSHDVDSVLDRGREFRCVKHEPAVANHADHWSVGLTDFDSERGWEGKPEVERVARIDVGLGVVDFVVGPRVPTELSNVPNDECVFGDRFVDRLDDFVWWLFKPDVVVGDEISRRGYRLRGRRTFARTGFDEIWD